MLRLRNRYRGGVAILTRDSSNLTVRERNVINEQQGLQHQAATWTVTSPTLASPLHLTAVYVSPTAGQLTTFFDLLEQQSAFPPDQVHLYTGDFNGRCGNLTEKHLHPAHDLAIPPRRGDTRDQHQPSPPDAPHPDGEFPTPAQRGRLLLHMLDNLGFVIANGRFQSSSCPSPPYTCFHRTGTSIVDYVLISKTNFKYLQSCRVTPRIKRSGPAKGKRTGTDITDHAPILVQLSLPATGYVAPAEEEAPPLPPGSNSSHRS